MELIDTKDGAKTLSLNKIFLHSRYSPIKEAEKFIKSNIKTKNTLVLLGAGLGYLYKAAQNLVPEVEIIGIPYNKELGEISLKLNPTRRSQWDMDTPLLTFISRSINNENIKDLQILEWQPSSAAFPDESKTVGNLLIQRIRRVNGNIMTTARFGKKWIRNSIRNFLNTESYISKIKIDKPVIIAASGKSLEKSFQLIKQARDKVTLISLTSANMALKANQIVPDISFSTDPGYYSKLHIYNTEQVLAMPLTNSTCGNNPVLLLNQGNYFEDEIIKQAELPNFRIGENGTVAGSALEFALKYSKGPVFLFGQDLAPSDIQSHVSPYAFEKLLKSDDSRRTSYYSIMYSRYINSGIAYTTYRDWFSRVANQNPGRIYRVQSNSQLIPGIADLNKYQFLEKLSQAERQTNNLEIMYSKALPSKKRQELVNELLKKWLNKIRNEKITQNPLFFLISTSKYTDVNNKALSPDEVENLLREGKEESILFIKRLLKLYGRELL